MELSVVHHRRYGSARRFLTAPPAPWAERRVVPPLEEALRRMQADLPVEVRRWRAPIGDMEERARRTTLFLAEHLVRLGILAPQPITFEFIRTQMGAYAADREAHILFARGLWENGRTPLPTVLHELLHLGHRPARQPQRKGAMVLEVTTSLLQMAVWQELFGPVTAQHAMRREIIGYREAVALPVLYSATSRRPSPADFGAWLLRLHRDEPGAFDELERRLERRLTEPMRQHLTLTRATLSRSPFVIREHAEDYHASCGHSFTDLALLWLGNDLYELGMETSGELAQLRRGMVPEARDGEGPVMVQYLCALTRREPGQVRWARVDRMRWVPPRHGTSVQQTRAYLQARAYEARMREERRRAARSQRSRRAIRPAASGAA